MSFLPQDYKAPSTNSSYMKIQQGENKFRILSRPILGWEDWDNNRPIRFRFENKPAMQIDPRKPVRHFWAMIAWNYAEEKIQVLHITQASVRNKIQALSSDKDWGEPYFYDLKIIKSGEGKDTEYEVNPLPHKDLHPSIEQAFHDKPCNLEALYDNGDPFSKEWKHFTEGVFKKPVPIMTVAGSNGYQIDIVPPGGPTNNELDQLHSILVSCSKEYQDQVDESLKKMGKKLAEIDANTYVRLLTAAKKKRDEYLTQNNEELPF